MLEVQPGQKQRAFLRPCLPLQATPPRVQHGEHAEMVFVSKVSGPQASGKIVDHLCSLSAARGASRALLLGATTQKSARQADCGHTQLPQ
ncbi:hypothetical protein GCM10010349_43730 [Streptomyces flavofungini]|nr:hypothetical protein GCM10010349_43730 [Streptomyces flavofungini]